MVQRAQTSAHECICGSVRVRASRTCLVLLHLLGRELYAHICDLPTLRYGRFNPHPTGLCGALLVSQPVVRCTPCSPPTHPRLNLVSLVPPHRELFCFNLGICPVIRIRSKNGFFLNPCYTLPLSFMKIGLVLFV